MRCPLCDAACTAPSGFGAVAFDGRRYDYRECRRCGSSACDPMPDAEALARMYGPAYASAGGADASVEDPKAPEQVIARLRSRSPGVFVDFGCGSGSLLALARDLGWRLMPHLGVHRANGGPPFHGSPGSPATIR